MATVRAKCRVMPELAYFHSVPNSTKTTKAQAVRMVREGVVPGVHDLHWDLCRGGYAGLTIEMKLAGRTFRKEQKAFAKFYAGQGVLSLRCFTDTEAWAAIQWYYALPPTPSSVKAALPAALASLAAPTQHRTQGDAARLAANAKRKRTLAAKRTLVTTAAKPTTAARPATPKPATPKPATTPAIKYPVRG